MDALNGARSIIYVQIFMEPIMNMYMSMEHVNVNEVIVHRKEWTMKWRNSNEKSPNIKVFLVCFSIVSFFIIWLPAAANSSPPVFLPEYGIVVTSSPEGVKVLGIVPHSIADFSEIRKSDLIVSIDDSAVSSETAIALLEKTLKKAGYHNFSVLREDKKKEIVFFVQNEYQNLCLESLSYYPYMECERNVQVTTMLSDLVQRREYTADIYYITEEIEEKGEYFQFYNQRDIFFFAKISNLVITYCVVMADGKYFRVYPGFSLLCALYDEIREKYPICTKRYYECEPTGILREIMTIEQQSYRLWIEGRIPYYANPITGEVWYQ